MTLWAPSECTCEKLEHILAELASNRNILKPTGGIV